MTLFANRGALHSSRRPASTVGSLTAAESPCACRDVAASRAPKLGARGVVGVSVVIDGEEAGMVILIGASRDTQNQTQDHNI